MAEQKDPSTTPYLYAIAKQYNHANKEKIVTTFISGCQKLITGLEQKDSKIDNATVLAKWLTATMGYLHMLANIPQYSPIDSFFEVFCIRNNAIINPDTLGAFFAHLLEMQLRSIQVVANTQRNGQVNLITQLQCLDNILLNLESNSIEHAAGCLAYYKLCRLAILKITEILNSTDATTAVLNEAASKALWSMRITEETNFRVVTQKFQVVAKIATGELTFEEAAKEEAATLAAAQLAS